MKLITKFLYIQYIKYALDDNITTIRIRKKTHKEILKVMGRIQAKTGKIPTIDDTLKELLDSYKKNKKI